MRRWLSWVLTSPENDAAWCRLVLFTGGLLALAVLLGGEWQ